MAHKTKNYVSVMSSSPEKTDTHEDVSIGVMSKSETRQPSMYKVVLLNDDYTPMEFVVHILESIFKKNRQDATQVMLMVHRKGAGVCGIYPYDVAETKVRQVLGLAEAHEHPLKCTLEKE